MTQGNIEDRLNSIERKLDALIVTVRGSTDYGARGLSPRVNNLEQRMDRLERTLNRITWTATGVGLATGFAGWGIGELIARIVGG